MPVQTPFCEGEASVLPQLEVDTPSRKGRRLSLQDLRHSALVSSSSPPHSHTRQRAIVRKLPHPHRKQPAGLADLNSHMHVSYRTIHKSRETGHWHHQKNHEITKRINNSNEESHKCIPNNHPTLKTHI